MLKKIIYKSKIDRVFCETEERFILKKNKIQIKIKGGNELVETNSATFYYYNPYYSLKIETEDLLEERTYKDFKDQVDEILLSFNQWLNDIKGVKTTKPLFFKGYIDDCQVSETGKKIVGSASMELFKIPQKKEVTYESINDMFIELDKSDGELEYLNQSKEFYEKRRQIFLSKNNVGNFIGLYAFLSEVLGGKHQKEIDNYIRKHTSYDSKNDRPTTRKDQSFDETIFSWLRNQIGHIDLNSTNFDEVSKEINDWHEELYNITLGAIKDNK